MNPQASYSHSRVYFSLLLAIAFAVTIWKYYKRRRREQHLRKLLEVPASNSYFDQLPHEMVEEIMSYLDLPSLLAAAQVSPYWHNLPCIHSLKQTIYKKEWVQPLSTNDVKEIRTVKEMSFNFYDSSYLPQWHVEDKYLAKRLNMNMFDVTLDTAMTLKSHWQGFPNANSSKNMENYLVKTRVKWQKEDANYKHFTNVSFLPEQKRKIKIAKNLINTKKIGEEYDVIANLSYFSNYGTLKVVHRFRPVKPVDWRLGALFALALLYVPVIVMDVSALLQNSQNLIGYIEKLGMATSYILVAVFGWCCLIAMRWRPNLFKILITTVVLIWSYCWFAGKYSDHWRNNGLCWIIGGGIEANGWLFRTFWARRNQFGLKITTSISTAIIALFLYAVDWNLLLDYTVTNRIWRTWFVNLLQIWFVWIQYNFARFFIETIENNLRPYWMYFHNFDRKMLRRAIPAQIAIAALCSVYAPAGFDNWPK